MKIIDLLNKIANGEAPEKIKYKNTIYEFKNIGCETGYVNEYGYEKHWFTNCFDTDDKYALNDEVEIIEEDKKIEKLKRCNNMQSFELINPTTNEKILGYKINELIEKINEMENNK